MKKATCGGMGCRRTVRLAAVDGQQPITERRAIPACARHALLWHRQGRGSIWIFALGNSESQSLSEDEIIKIVDASTDPPLQRR